MKKIGLYTLGFISSNCCIIQLIANYFSLGCSGLATAVTFASLLVSLISEARSPCDSVRGKNGTCSQYRLMGLAIKKKSAIHVLAVLLLASTPEIVGFYNNYFRVAPPDNVEIASYDGILLQIEGMKCEGCRNGVKTAILGVDGVFSCNVSAHDSIARVYAKASTDDDALTNAVAQKKFNAFVLWRGNGNELDDYYNNKYSDWSRHFYG